MCFLAVYGVDPIDYADRLGASNKRGLGEISSLQSLSLNISKTVPDTAKVTIND